MLYYYYGTFYLVKEVSIYILRFNLNSKILSHFLFSGSAAFVLTTPIEMSGDQVNLTFSITYVEI